MCNNTRKGSEYEMKESERAEEWVYNQKAVSISIFQFYLTFLVIDNNRKESIGNFKKMAVLEHGGCPPFLSVEDEQTKQFLKPVFPSVWPYQSSFIQFDKERLMPKPANKSMNPTGGKNITRPREWETISKKPSNPHLGREMKFGKLPSSTSSNTGTSTSPSINTSTFSREQTNEGIKTSETDSKRGTRVTDSVDDGWHLIVSSSLFVIAGSTGRSERENPKSKTCSTCDYSINPSSRFTSTSNFQNIVGIR